MARSAASTKKESSHRASSRALKAALWVFLVALVSAAIWFGSRKVWESVVHRPEFQVNARAISLNTCPYWVDGPRMAQELSKELAELPESESLFERDLAHAVQHELRSSPWVLDVTRVRRRMPSTLLVKAVFRRPAAVVLFGTQQYMIDRDGHWLPEDLFNRPPEWEHESLPVIVDRLLGEPPPVGERWDGPRMAAGARLADFLRREGLFEVLPVDSIDVTGVGREIEGPDILLVAAQGGEVRWGESSVYAQVAGLTALPFLVPDYEKLEMLLSKLDEYPNLQGIKYVDLRFHGKISFMEDDQPPAAG